MDFGSGVKRHRRRRRQRYTNMQRDRRGRGCNHYNVGWRWRRRRNNHDMSRRGRNHHRVHRNAATVLLGLARRQITAVPSTLLAMRIREVLMFHAIMF